MPTHAEKHRSNEPERCACSGGGVTDTTSIQDVLPVAVSNASGHSSIFRIPAMDCPNEENDIRKALAGIAGIRSLRFELAARTLTIEGEQLALESGLQAIRQLGFESFADLGGLPQHGFRILVGKMAAARQQLVQRKTLPPHLG